MVAAGLQEALQPALQPRRSWPPLAQREDTRGVVACAMQQLVKAARACLLAAAIRQGLRSCPRRQESGRQQQEQQQEGHSSPGDLWGARQDRLDPSL